MIMDLSRREALPAVQGLARNRFGMVTIRNLPPHREPGYGGTGASAGTCGLVLRYTCHIPPMYSCPASRRTDSPRDPFPRGINTTRASRGALDLFPSGDAAPGVTEVGDGLQFTAEGADVVAQGGEFGHGAALDGRDTLLGHAHRVGNLGLGQAGLLAHLDQVLGPDL